MREKGLILSGVQFLPWTSIKSHRWGGASSFQLNLQLDKWLTSVLVNEDEKEKLNDILNVKLSDPNENP